MCLCTQTFIFPVFETKTEIINPFFLFSFHHRVLQALAEQLKKPSLMFFLFDDFIRPHYTLQAFEGGDRGAQKPP